jgi:hypothetical protein
MTESGDMAKFNRMNRYMMEKLPKKLVEKDLLDAANGMV